MQTRQNGPAHQDCTRTEALSLHHHYPHPVVDVVSPSETVLLIQGLAENTFRDSGAGECWSQSLQGRFPARDWELGNGRSREVSASLGHINRKGAASAGSVGISNRKPKAIAGWASSHIGKKDFSVVAIKGIPHHFFS